MNTNSKIQALNDTFKKVLEACPEITYIGDEVLRKRTQEVSLAEGLAVSEKLISVLKRYRAITGYGRGLAAPQIGESKSVFVTYVGDEFKIYINPKIIKNSESQNLFVESCLSCGYVSVEVKRSESITIEYTNEKGEIQRQEAGGLLARLLQHEYDHLEGIVNVDKAEMGTIQFMTDDPLKQTLRKIN
jgi:peptide deformylase